MQQKQTGKRYTLTKSEVKKAERALKEVAVQHGITLSEVRENICGIINESMNCADPAVRALWESAPFGHQKPTPGEFVAWCTRLVHEQRTEDAERDPQA